MEASTQRNGDDNHSASASSSSSGNKGVAIDQRVRQIKDKLLQSSGALRTRVYMKQSPNSSNNNQHSNNNNNNNNNNMNGSSEASGVGKFTDGGWSQVPENLQEEMDFLRKFQTGYNLTSVMNDPHEKPPAAPQVFVKELSGLIFKGEGLEGKLPLPSIIQHVELKDFQRFRQANKKLADIFIKNHEKKQNDVPAAANYSKLVEMVESLERGVLPTEDEPTLFHLATASGNSMSGGDVDLLRKCFQIVPDRYFLQSFQVMINDAEYFQNLVKAEDTRLIEDKLSAWLDLVEVCLWSQTTSRSGDFFEAISDLKHLLGHVNNAHQTVSLLRNNLGELKEMTALKQLKILHLKRRRENVHKLHRITGHIIRIRATQPTIDTLLNAGDYDGALQVIEATQELLNTELRGLTSLRSLGRHLLEYQDLIGGAISDKFVALCSTVLDGSWLNIKAIPEEKVGGDTSFHDEDDEDEDEALQKKITPFVVNLLKTGGSGRLRTALQHHRTRTLELVKLTAKSVVKDTLENVVEVRSMDLRIPKGGPEVASPTNQSQQQQRKTPPLRQPSESAQDAEFRSELLTSMTAAEFSNFLRLVFESLDDVLTQAMLIHDCVAYALKHEIGPVPTGKDAELVEKVRAQHSHHGHKHHHHHASSSSSSGTDPSSNFEVDQDLLLVSSRFVAINEESRVSLTKESLAVVTQICEYSQKVVIKLLRYRQDHHAHGKLKDFKSVWAVTLDFINLCESHCGYRGLDLRNVLADQANSFLQIYHDKEKAAVFAALDADLWEVVDVPFDIQDSVNRIFSSNPQSVIEGISSVSSMSTTGSIKFEIQIQDKLFKTSNSALVCVKSLEGYLRCALEFPVLGPRALGRMIELYSGFNERTNKLVLLAGACQGGRLETIKAKHLSVAAQSLSVLIAMLPGISNMLEKCLSQQQKHHRDAEITRINTQLEVLRQKIFNKMVSLIEALVNDKCRDLATNIDWDSRVTDGLGKPQEYMVKITQGVTTLHTVLSEVLLKEHLQIVFHDIYKLMNTRIPELFANVEPTTSAGKTRVRVDIYHLLSSLRIRGLQGPGNSLEEWLLAKYGRR